MARLVGHVEHAGAMPPALTLRHLRLTLLLAFTAAMLWGGMPAYAVGSPGLTDICTTSLDGTLPGPANGPHCPDCLLPAMTPPVAWALSLHHELRHVRQPSATASQPRQRVAAWSLARGPPTVSSFEP